MKWIVKMNKFLKIAAYIASKWRCGNLELHILEVTKPKTVPVVGFERTAKLQNRFFSLPLSSRQEVFKRHRKIIGKKMIGEKKPLAA